jgi:hypothetical protein
MLDEKGMNFDQFVSETDSNSQEYEEESSDLQIKAENGNVSSLRPERTGETTSHPGMFHAFLGISMIHNTKVHNRKTPIQIMQKVLRLRWRRAARSAQRQPPQTIPFLSRRTGEKKRGVPKN